MTESLQVLLVDDDDSLSYSFKSILEAEGFQVTLAQTSKEALQILSEKKFDLYLIDILLPDINGDELVKIIRSSDNQTPIILITGYASFQDSINVLDLGIYEILLKPIGPKELIRACKEAISPNVLTVVTK